jgi:hypothetical protein
MKELHSTFMARGDAGSIDTDSRDAEYDYGYTAAYRNAAESLKERLNKSKVKWE